MNPWEIVGAAVSALAALGGFIAWIIRYIETEAESKSKSKNSLQSGLAEIEKVLGDKIDAVAQDLNAFKQQSAKEHSEDKEEVLSAMRTECVGTREFQQFVHGRDRMHEENQREITMLRNDTREDLSGVRRQLDRLTAALSKWMKIE